MRAWIDEDGYINIEAITNAEVFAIKYNRELFGGSLNGIIIRDVSPGNDAGGIIWGLTKDEVEEIANLAEPEKIAGYGEILKSEEPDYGSEYEPLNQDIRKML